MPSFTDVIAGVGAFAQDVQQIIDALKGTAGKGIPLAPVAVNDANNFALAVRNNDASASKAFIVYKADGTVLFQIDKNGVVGSPDGTLTAAQLVTVAAAQDLTGKTYAATQAGAVAAARFIGGTASGAPTTGAHLLGDFVIDQTGKVWICTVAGTPGTWVQSGAVLHTVAVNDTIYALRNFL